MSEVKYVGLEAAEALIQETQNRLNDKSPINHSHNLSSTSASGFLRQLNGNTSNFLRGDGTWATPPDTDTTYSTGNSSTPGITKLYTGTGTNTDGTMTQNAITSALSGKASSDHNHSASNITSGTLSVERGGTGVTTNPMMIVNLGSNSTTNVFATSPRPGVMGTLSIENGGTGATSASVARQRLGITPANIGAATSDHSHNNASTSSDGFMSSEDKTKLNGIATGANKYTLPTASSSTLGGVKTTSTVTSNSGYTACPIISGVPYYKDTNTTYTVFASSKSGLVPAPASSDGEQFLCNDGTWVEIASDQDIDNIFGIVTDGDTEDGFIN